jgi:hypothetical protein
MFWIAIQKAFSTVAVTPLLSSIKNYPRSKWIALLCTMLSVSTPMFVIS